MSLVESVGATHKYFEVPESLLPQKAFEAGALYITDTGRFYFDSGAHNKRVELGPQVTYTTAVDFNDLVKNGVYIIENTSSTNKPVASKGTLYVHSGPTVFTQMYVATDGYIYSRGGVISDGTVSSFSAWRQVDLTVATTSNTINTITTGNLNDYRSEDIFYVKNASTITNCPSPSNGILIVLNDSTDTAQYYNPNSGDGYYRTYDTTNEIWSSWAQTKSLKELSTTRVNPSNVATDINGYVTYANTVFENIANVTNLPVAKLGFLEVRSTSNYVLQRYTTIENVTYTRIGTVNGNNWTWGTWKQLAGAV